MKVNQEKISYLTMIFGADYGLPMILMGLAFTFFSLMKIVIEPFLKPFNSVQNYYFRDVILIFTISSFLVVLPVSTMFLQKYYTRKFGNIVRRENITTVSNKILFFMSILISFFLGTWIDVNYLPAVSATLSIIAVALILNWFLVSRPAANVDLMLGILIGILSFVPALGIVSKEGFYLAGKFADDFFINFTMLIWGLVYIFKGLYDHFFIKEMLSPALMEEINEFI